MYHTIEEFLQEWETESKLTLKIFKNLTNDSLLKPIPAYRRTIGRIAWHITTAIGEMMKTAGFQIDAAEESSNIPSSAAKIYEEYHKASKNFVEKLKAEWTDKLKEEVNMYGEMWTREFTLRVIVSHQLHHRAQLTVLMRLVGLKVPGTYGPSFEEWKQYGMEAQA